MFEWSSECSFVANECLSGEVSVLGGTVNDRGWQVSVGGG